VRSSDTRDALPDALGKRFIVFYKLGRAALQGLAAVVLLAGARHGLGASLARLAHRVADHAVHATVAALARRILTALPHLQLLAVALAGDATLAGVEGWALARGHQWGEWLVVVTTGSLLPWEAWELAHRHRFSRLLLLLVNVAMVVYLARRITKRRRPPEEGTSH
jgi:uncharacterized membrane protein (DUF2068 family)